MLPGSGISELSMSPGELSQIRQGEKSSAAGFQTLVSDRIARIWMENL
jgi:hypothetical protein